jgi:hypothetical protein
VIDSTFLGVEDHGIFTFSLGLNYGHSCQSAGNICLGNSKTVSPRSGPALWEILKVVGVSQWEHLKGKSVHAILDGDGWNARVIGLRSFIGEREIIFSDFFEAMP